MALLLMVMYNGEYTMGRRVERTHAGKTWTKARYFSFIRSALRKAWSRYPVRFHVLAKAARPYKGTDKRRKKEFQCAICEEWFMPVSYTHLTLPTNREV